MEQIIYLGLIFWVGYYFTNEWGNENTEYEEEK